MAIMIRRDPVGSALDFTVDVNGIVDDFNLQYESSRTRSTLRFRHHVKLIASN